MNTVIAITIFDTVDWHPALKFTAVREKDPAMNEKCMVIYDRWNNMIWSVYVDTVILLPVET